MRRTFILYSCLTLSSTLVFSSCAAFKQNFNGESDTGAGDGGSSDDSGLTAQHRAEVQKYQEEQANRLQANQPMENGRLPSEQFDYQLFHPGPKDTHVRLYSGQLPIYVKRTIDEPGLELYALYSIQGCAPCHALFPKLKKKVDDINANGGKAILAVMDLDADILTAKFLGFHVAPTVLVYKNGEEKERFNSLE